MAKKLTREEVIKKINAFLNMTVERGAGENEARKAAKHAADLLAEYDLTFADLTDPSEITGKAGDFKFRDDLSRFMYVLTEAVGELCAVEVLSHGHGRGLLKIIGSPIDVDFAEYLCAICLRAIEEQADKANKEYALLRFNVKRRQVESLLQGMAHRLSERIKELAWARRTAMSNALVVSKEDIIAKTMKDNHIEVKIIPFRERHADPDAYRLGVERAERVPLSNAIHARKTNEVSSSFEQDGE